MNDDLTRIIIDIRGDNSEIMTCIKNSISFMDGWSLDSNLYLVPPECRIFAFNLSLKRFEWWRSTASYSDTMDEDEFVINTLADISWLLEFVYLNAERCESAPKPPDFANGLFNSVMKMPMFDYQTSFIENLPSKTNYMKEFIKIASECKIKLTPALSMVYVNDCSDMLSLQEAAWSGE
jgi:hypothetical protein